MIGWTVWLHGLVSSGKSTISKELYNRLLGENIILFDGDILREIVDSKLGYTRKDRCEQARKYVEIRYKPEYKEFNLILSTNSHFEENREIFRNGLDRYIEIYIKCPLEICEERDPKGIYRGARNGIFKHVPGIGDKFEEPTKQSLTLETDKLTVDECVEEILRCIKERFYT